MIQEEKQSGFVAGTLVHTDKGLVPIDQLQVGDMVLSKDESGEGEVIYKSVTRIIKTDNVYVYFAKFIPDSLDDLPVYKLKDLTLYADLLVTEHHLFLIEDNGWIAAEHIEINDVVILKDDSKARCSGGGYNAKGIETVFKTDQHNIGFVPDFGGEDAFGQFIDLTTGKQVKSGNYQPVYKKLHAIRNLWNDPTTVKWGEGEGPVTTTVYNFEVVETHTYFVGEHGVWVHDASTNIS